MQELIAVIFGFWAIMPVLFTYETSRISVTHQNVYLSLIIMKYTKEEMKSNSRTQGTKIRTTHNMFLQFMIMQSSKYAHVRRTLPTNQHLIYKFYVSEVNNVYFDSERHMGKLRHCVPGKVWKL